MFSNPVVGGTTLVRPAIQSPNYVAGVSGWTINADGTAEFNNVTIRGTLQSSNFVAGTSGWRLNNSGSAEFNGAVTVAGGGAITINPAGPSSILISASSGNTIQMKTGATGETNLPYVAVQSQGSGATTQDTLSLSSGQISGLGDMFLQLNSGTAAGFIPTLQVWSGVTLLGTWDGNALAVVGSTGGIRFRVVGNTGTDFGGGDRFRVWNDGEVWMNAIGIGGDNPNGTGIYFNQGRLNMNFFPISLRGNNDDNNAVSYNAGLDGIYVVGWQGVHLGRASAGWTVEFGGSGFYTNLGWGLGTGGDLNSAVFGAATGGTLKTKSGGNFIRFDWGGPLSFWIDVTNVKTFVIPHPVQKEKSLIHACLEGPESAVFYRGMAQLENGWVRVSLPEYFEALCAEEGRSVQITCIADDPKDEWCPVLHATYPKKGCFYVGLGSGVVVQDQRFWWQVIAVRKDVAPLLIEPDSAAIDVLGQGPYTYYRER